MVVLSRLISALSSQRIKSCSPKYPHPFFHLIIIWYTSGFFLCRKQTLFPEDLNKILKLQNQKIWAFTWWKFWLLTGYLLILFSTLCFMGNFWAFENSTLVSKPKLAIFLMMDFSFSRLIERLCLQKPGLYSPRRTWFWWEKQKLRYNFQIDGKGWTFRRRSEKCRGESWCRK